MRAVVSVLVALVAIACALFFAYVALFAESHGDIAIAWFSAFAVMTLLCVPMIATLDATRV